MRILIIQVLSYSGPIATTPVQAIPNYYIKLYYNLAKASDYYCLEALVPYPLFTYYRFEALFLGRFGGGGL